AGRFPLVPAGVSIIVRPRLFGRRGDLGTAAVLLHRHRGRPMPKRLHGKTPLGIFGAQNNAGACGLVPTDAPPAEKRWRTPNPPRRRRPLSITPSSPRWSGRRSHSA